jgi:SAM-dependent methyltransferase
MNRGIVREVRFPRAYTRDGLRREISLANLSNVVILTGPNGSGKTRLLHRIQDEINASCARLKNDPRSATPHTVLEFAEGIDPARIRTLRLEGIIPWTKPLGDYSISELHALAKNMEQDANNLPTIMGNGLAILQSVSTVHLIASHPDIPNSPPARLGAWFNRLKADIKRYAESSIDFDSSGEVRLYDRSVMDLRESDGQRKLIQYATGLSSISQSTGTQDAQIVFLDEPEINLHPGALISLIDRLFAAIPNAQFFIATHSLPLIAHLGMHNTWFAQDGEFRAAMVAPESTILSLFGGDENVERLRSALDEPAYRAIAQFAAESLVIPETADYKIGDPQCAQILAEVRKRADANGRVRVLDFGAGKGRLAAALSALRLIDVDYYAFNPDPASEIDCKASIALLHPEEIASRFHSTLVTVEQQASLKKFDIVILCNVLHEVHPSFWKEMLHKTISSNLLAENGVLLLLEDLWMPHGELAYDEGFLLLDPASIQALFAVTPGPDFAYQFAPDPRYHDRLISYIVSRSALTRIDDSTILTSLQYTIERTKKDIMRLRKEAVTHRNARRHANCLTQLANALLIHDSLSGSIDSIAKEMG